MTRPRLNQHTKRITGTLRGCRELQATGAERLTAPPPPPAHLGEVAAKEWRALAKVLVEAGTLAATDLRSLELLCQVLATEAEARETVARAGFTTETGDGGAKTHPATKTMETARGQAVALLQQFGMSPRARQSVAPAPDAAADDPAREYFT